MNPDSRFNHIQFQTAIQTLKFKLPVLSIIHLGHMIRHPKIGTMVKACVKEFPAIELETQIQPITRTVLRIRLTIIPKFKWHRKVMGGASNVVGEL